ncbi:MAG: glycoside hydrolase family 9 protein [Candidatus Hydrogenedentes bacterium]|nr:glycoside hydrolase family 9 protein [Candidatus Hydrogenedentota bacterium]
MLVRITFAITFFCVCTVAAQDLRVARTFPDEWNVSPSSGAAEWSFDAGAIEPGRSFIVECICTAKRGSPWLKAQLIDAQGTLLLELPALGPMPGGDKRFITFQTPLHDAATGLRVIGGSDEDATFSELRVIPTSPGVLGNTAFALPLDRKGRVTLWDEELSEIFPGNRAGTRQLDSTLGHSAPGSVVLTATGDWFTLSSISYPIPVWTDRFHAEAWAQCRPSASAAVALVWSGDSAQDVLRVDVGEPTSSTEWTRLSSPSVSPPHDARTLRMSLIVRGGEVVWDDAELISELPVAPVVRVLVNQAGYETIGPKHAVLMTNAPPSETANAFGLTDADQREHKGELEYAGRVVGQGGADWGWYFWRADFSAVKKPDTYHARASLGETHGISHPFGIGHQQLFRATVPACIDFFFVQRCGGDVPGWHKPCHMDDAKLPDGTHRDLTGGWHSAGDYNKLSWEYGDSGVTYALTAVMQADPVFCARFNRDEDRYEDAFDEAVWGAQYLSKLQTDSGTFYQHVQQGPDRTTWMRWAAPEDHTDNVRGTPDDPVVLEGEGNAPLAIGAWARLANQLSTRENESDYLERAIKAWEALAANPARAADPLLLISTVDLFVATKEARFREHAQAAAMAILEGAPADGVLGGGYAKSGDVPAAALAHFVLEMPGDPLKSRIKDRLALHLDAFVAEPRNAFGVSQQQMGADGFFFEPSSAYGHNFEYLCRAWSALKVYRVLEDKRALAYALDHFNFVLGANPYDLCMMEGVGAVNPPRYHHRYNKIPGRETGKVPGAIPNGFVRDMMGQDRPGFDLSTGGREYPSYRTSEPWLVHNVFYLLAISELRAAQK